jgi:hypothetical protein
MGRRPNCICNRIDIILIQKSPCTFNLMWPYQNCCLSSLIDPLLVWLYFICCKFLSIRLLFRLWTLFFFFLSTNTMCCKKFQMYQYWFLFLFLFLILNNNFFISICHPKNLKVCTCSMPYVL